MKIFLSSHGKMASGIKSSIDLLVGSSDNLIVHDAYLNDENLEEVVKSFINDLPYDEKVLFLSDLYGGSVNQVLSRYIDNERFFLISGFNLALVLEAIMMEDINEKVLDYLVDVGKKAVKIVSLDDVEIKQDNNIDDFFD